MAKAKTNSLRGKHPNSTKNLIHEGRPSAEEIYGELKKRRTLSVTESGWKGAVEVLRAAGYSSVSEYLEKLGRKQVFLPK